jgi:predicted DNA-binding transcriptional regulator YafY
VDPETEVTQLRAEVQRLTKALAAETTQTDAFWEFIENMERSQIEAIREGTPDPWDRAEDPSALVLDYTDHRGDRSPRTVVPVRVWFGKTSQHPERQWLLDAYERAARGVRTFALLGVHSVRRPPDG